VTVPLFSVVVATLNAATLIGATLDSLARQTCDDWELWLVDAASTDGTAALARQRGDARIHVLSEPDQGIADAWNKGVQRSQGRWVVFLGAGDTLPPDALARLAEAARPWGEGEAILYGDTLKQSPGGPVQAVPGRAIGPRGPRLGFPFMHPATATSRSAMARVGAFDTRLRIAVDSDFLLRAWCLGVAFARSEHTAVMLTGGVSDRRWLAANLEYADCVARHLKLSPLRHQALRWGVNLRYVAFKRLGLSRPLRVVRRVLPGRR
jgi:glycosyltransferase involved in cell wall biosynthesis